VLANYLKDGPRWSTEVTEAAEERKISKRQFNSAKLKINGRSKRVDGSGPWFMCLPEHEKRQPEGPQ